MNLVDHQVSDLGQVFPGASATPLPGGMTLVSIPNVMLPGGWSQPATAVAFVVPVGYPMARPDCFYTDVSLRLASGGLPMNSSPQPVPGAGDTRLWFSWHLASWNPGRDTLLTYVRVIQDRLARPQ